MCQRDEYGTLTVLLSLLFFLYFSLFFFGYCFLCRQSFVVQSLFYIIPRGYHHTNRAPDACHGVCYTYYINYMCRYNY